MGEAFVITEWKKTMAQHVASRYPDLTTSQINDILNDIIGKRLQNRECVLINNYVNKSLNTTILQITDLIKANGYIVAGKGALYVQHDQMENPLVPFILHVMGERDRAKAERTNYAKGSIDYKKYDMMQSIMKLLINSLYGATGYPKFILFNQINAEAVTNQGKQIITSAHQTFENFMADNVNFHNENELFMFIHQVWEDYQKIKDAKKDVAGDKELSQITTGMVIDRLLYKCVFTGNKEALSTHLHEMMKNKQQMYIVMLYYKNNISEFNKLSIVKNLQQVILSNIGTEDIWKLSYTDNSTIKEALDDIWTLYEIFVYHNHPIPDRVRKAAYNHTKAVLYTDTDSTFLALSSLIQSTKENCKTRDATEVRDISLAFWIHILGIVVNKTLFTMCLHCGITPEWAKLLSMKNEFVLSRILFTPAKKRYVANALFQEGSLLGDGKGDPEIKGFDFKKASVKPVVRDFYTNLCLEEILNSESINVGRVFAKVSAFKSEIEKDLRAGNATYVKQASVNIISSYKKPYSHYTVPAVMLWNVLMPQYAHELPTDIDIIPIRELTFPHEKSREHRTPGKDVFDLENVKNKNIHEFAEKFPAEYNLVKRAIYNNDNPLIQHMSLKYVAKPKDTSQIELPGWYDFLIDTDKTTQDIMTLIFPLLKALGLKIMKVSANKERLTNVISI